MIELIPIFCDIDDFCKDYEEYCTKSLLMDKNTIIPKTTLSLSEIMTIVVYFHQSKFRNFKSYYKTIILGFLKSYFTKSVSYNRFVELMRYSLIPLLLYTIQYSFGKCSGISFLNSTPIKVCDNHRISSHKVFKDFAKKEHSSTGFFYGFKFHLITNGKGEILSFCLTSGNIDDHDWNVISTLIKEIYVKIFADCGYISSKLFEKLHDENITLVTRIRRNMKNKLMDFQDRLILRKRSIIETINDFLKNICQIEHSRHRSVHNFLVNIVSALCAYSLLPKKPSLFDEKTVLTNTIL